MAVYQNACPRRRLNMHNLRQNINESDKEQINWACLKFLTDFNHAFSKSNFKTIGLSITNFRKINGTLRKLEVTVTRPC